jgi:hypothetical protein
LFGSSIDRYAILSCRERDQSKVDGGIPKYTGERRKEPWLHVDSVKI